jgi:hypothetical protein
MGITPDIRGDDVPRFGLLFEILIGTVPQKRAIVARISNSGLAVRAG